MNVIDSRPLRQTSLVLPLVGIVVSLTVVVDFTMRLFDPDVYKPEGLFSLLNEFIDRGVILLIGLALISAGFWLNKALTRPATDLNIAANSPLSNPQFWTFVFASLLGLLFLVLVPFHYSISGQVLNQMVSTASTRADQQEAQARDDFQQQQEQANNLIAKGQVDQLLQQKNLSPQQFAFLQAIKLDPKAVDKKAAQSLAELKTQKQQALDQINKVVNGSRWRVEVRSILLAIGFVALGWTGLRDAS
jgi:hypothetical protein